MTPMPGADSLPAAVIDRENPWPGLDAYDERAAAYFKGRREVTGDLLRLVLREDLVLLYGVSGLGKTSLLRAGLFPALPENVLPVYLRLNWVTTDTAHGTKATRAVPFTGLVAQVIEAAQKAAAERDIEPPTRPPRYDQGLWEYFRRADDGFWSRGGLLMTPLLVFDQFEEMFTRVESPHAAQRHFEHFLHDVAHLVSGREPEWYEAACRSDEHLEQPAYTRQAGVCKVVFSFREDYLANVKGLSRIIPSIDRIFVRLEPMTRKAAALAVCEAGGHLMNATAPREQLRTSLRIIRKVSHSPGRLGVTHTVDSALLSLFCKELNDERRRRTPPLIDRALVESAETSRIFEGFYERAMRMVSPVTQDFIEHNLVLPGTRSRWPAAEQSALAAGVPPADLETLTKLRIIRPDVSAGVARFELTHDVLVDVVLDSRARREEQVRHAQERQALAEEAERTRRSLIEEWQHRRTRLMGWAIAVALLLLAVAGIALVNVSRLQRQQQARLLADAAYSEAGQDVRVSAILARRSLDEAARAGIAMPLAEITLNSALRAPFVRARHSLTQQPLAIVPNDSATLLALVTARQVEVRRAPDFATAQSVTLNRDVFTVAFDEADALLIVYADTSIDRVDLRQGTLQPVPLAGPVAADRVTTEAAVSADGQHILLSSVADFLSPIDAPAWISRFEPGNGWQSPVQIPGGTLTALSTDAGTHATLDVAGRLTVTGPDGQRTPYQAGPSLGLELSADGTHAVFVQGAGQNLAIRMLDLETGRAWSGTLPRSAEVTGARFSPDGTRVAVAQTDGAISIWDVDAGRGVFQVPYAQRFVFSRDSEELLTWSSSQSVERWSARTGQAFDRVGRHDDLVSIAITASDSSIVTAAGRELYVWSRPALDRVLPTKHAGEVLTAAISADGGRIATAEPGSVHVYDVRAGELLDTVEEDQPTALAFSPDGQQVAIGTEAGAVVIHPVGDRGNTRARATTVGGLSVPGDPPLAVSAITFVPSSGRLVVARAGGGDSRISLQDPSTQATSHEVAVPGNVVTLAAKDDSAVVAGIAEYRRYDVEDTPDAHFAAGTRFVVLPLTGPSTSVQPTAAAPDAPPPPPPPPTAVPEADDSLAPPPPPPGASLRSPFGDGASCQDGVASVNPEGTLAAGITSCERVLAYWRNLQDAATTLNMERPLYRIAVAPERDFIAIAFVNGAVWMFHIDFPSRPVVLQGAGSPRVSWLGFTAPADETNARRLQVVAVRADRSIAVYPVGVSELLEHARARGDRWAFNQTDCSKYFGGMTGMSPCEDAGFWRMVARGIMTSPSSR